MDPLFQVHKLNPEGIDIARGIAGIFNSTLDALSLYCPLGREFSIMKTKLEEACFFAKKAMANNPNLQAE